MNKKELIDRIAQSTGLSKVQASRVLDSTILLIEEHLVDKPKPRRALDSTIALMREQGKPPKKGRALDSTIDLIDPALVESGKKSTRALDSTIHLLEEELVTAGKVKIPGLGTFYTVARKARVGRNPRTGAEVQIKARIIPRFKPSRTLIDRVNG